MGEAKVDLKNLKDDKWDGEIKLNEEELLWLGKLEMNRLSFKRQLVKRLTHARYRLILIDDVKARFEDKNETLIAEVEWILLGRHAMIEKGCSWEWPWLFMEGGSQIKEQVIQALPEDKKVLIKGLIETSSPMLISYLHAILTDQLRLEYIYVKKCENVYYSFGLKNIEWIGSEGDLELRFKKDLEKLAREKSREFNEAVSRLCESYDMGSSI